MQIPNQQHISLGSSCNSSNNQKVVITSCCSHAEKNCPTLLSHHSPNNSLLFTTPTYPTNNSTAASPLTTSKSENNIFDKHNLSISYTTNNFEVVNSLSDLSDDLNYYERDSKPMNDLSRPQILNQFSDDDLNDENFIDSKINEAFSLCKMWKHCCLRNLDGDDILLIAQILGK